MVPKREPGTKIVATVGPASAAPGAIERLVRAGTDVFRLNFSHGRRDEHEEALRTIRAVSERLNSPVAIMGDLCGPKIRLLEVEDGAIELVAGDQLRIVSQPVVGNVHRVALNHSEVLGEIKVGDRVLIDDGAVRLHVVARKPDELLCECSVGGRIGSRKGLNLPDSDIPLPALTSKDLDDLAWAAEVGLEYVALSFVRSSQDVDHLRDELVRLGADCQVVSKIETRKAVDNLEAIIQVSDIVLIARGDLGVEVDLATVPTLQKRITHRCRRAGRPVIIATQMLQSMVESPTPTRAEVSDVANAIFDGADATMLSAETAIGAYPVEAVRMLDRIAAEAESHDEKRASATHVVDTEPRVPAAVARSICAVADDSNARAVLVWTETGTLARLISKHRLDILVIGLTASVTVQRRMSLYYGVVPLHAARPEGTNQLLRLSDNILTEGEWAAPGNLVVVGFGPRSLAGGESGAIMIHTVSAWP